MPEAERVDHRPFTAGDREPLLICPGDLHPAQVERCGSSRRAVVGAKAGAAATRSCGARAEPDPNHVLDASACPRSRQSPVRTPPPPTPLGRPMTLSGASSVPRPRRCEGGCPSGRAPRFPQAQDASERPSPAWDHRLVAPLSGPPRAERAGRGRDERADSHASDRSGHDRGWLTGSSRQGAKADSRQADRLSRANAGAIIP